MKNTSYFLRFNKVLNKKTDTVSRMNLHNDKINRRIKLKEVTRHTYCDDLDTTANDDTQ